MKISSILGLNSRTQLFAYRYNSKRSKNIADSKIQTARILKNADVSHPKIYKKFTDPKSVIEFDWSTLPDQFALKPSRGMGGEGIIVVKRRPKSTKIKSTNLQIRHGSQLIKKKSRLTI
jgi:predicted ATP-grasp superfamily ATP-dependent carboligase